MAGILLQLVTRRVAAVAPSALQRIAHPQRNAVARTAVQLLSQQRSFSSATVTFTFIDSDGNETKVTAKEDQTLLEVAHDNDIELEGACGGELACSTCHLIFEKDVYDNLPETTEEEEDMLDLAWGLTDTSRLGCQIHVSKDLEGARIRVPAETDNLM